jgi:chromosome segregation ATPase
MLWTFLFIGVLTVPFWASVAAAAASPGNMRVQIRDLWQEGDALGRQRLTLMTTQKNLLQQQQELETSAQQLAGQQIQLNQQAETHNQQVATQEKSLHKNRLECNNTGVVTGANTANHVNECDNAIKALNAKTTGINAGAPNLAAQQAAVAEQVAENQLKINAWYLQEHQTVNQLNLVYRNTNDWMERAYVLIASSHFQRTAYAAHADYALVCLRRVLGAGATAR